MRLSLWPTYRRRDNPNAALVKNLTKIETEIRTEIAREQVTVWTKEQIKKVYG